MAGGLSFLPVQTDVRHRLMSGRFIRCQEITLAGSQRFENLWQTNGRMPMAFSRYTATVTVASERGNFRPLPSNK